MRYAVVLILLLLNNAAHAQPSSAPDPAREVLTLSDLESHGVVRLSDVFELVQGWAGSTVEGFTWTLGAGGLASPGQSAWALYVNGIPVDFSTLERQDVNLLPITVLQIDSIEVFSRPTFLAGRMHHAGVLHLHTRRADPGVRLRGEAAAGNETGDPGPYFFTSRRTPNIDRIGPSLAASLSYGGTHAWISASMRSDEHHATDPQQLRRVYGLYEGTYRPRLLLASPGLVAGVRTAQTVHNLAAGYTRLQDLAFIEPLGREVPMNTLFGYVGAAGQLRGKAVSVDYSIAFSEARLAERQNRRGAWMDWRQQRLDGHFGSSLNFGAAKIQLGTRLSHRYLITTQALARTSVLAAGGYAGLSVKAGRQFEQNIVLSATGAGGSVGFRGIALTGYRPSPGSHGLLTLAWSRELPEERADLAYWQLQGYRLPSTLPSETERPPYLIIGEAATVNASWSHGIGSDLRIALYGLYRFFPRQNLRVSSAVVAVDTVVARDAEFFFTTSRIAPDADGRVYGMGGSVSFSSSGLLRHVINYRFQRPVSSNEAFWQAWAVEPWHRLMYSLTFSPVERFSIEARLRYRSPVEWPGYREVDRATSWRFPSRLPGILMFDAYATKQLWDDHARAGFALKNLLDREVRWHPAGAISGLTFHVYLTLALP